MERIEIAESSDLRASPRAVWGRTTTLPGGGTRVSEHVRFRPRAAAWGWLRRAAIAAIFRHRHSRLDAFFAGR